MFTVYNREYNVHVENRLFLDCLIASVSISPSGVNFSYGNEFDLQDNKHASRSQFHMKGVVRHDFF